ncbi:U6 snRNA-associated Sm-like protein LSm1 [Hondaea fermentalgiana]|uniref:U6 snRNA-associated Sm-like protein LSm1 n=1 Tax=Hondaea fermentalgiana TaxID=2315210 RepID=A0A2R5GBH0_9STRA|nr:U6 snRNA-associated Sm-like protein LSm1 [Hondaea fermentalgiana]|eukprot:GBG28337.1 U6 snRNA-associated Sm-like protein LSm1 [Hondaea fermentalgiana]
MESATAVAEVTASTWVRRDSRMEAAVVRVLGLAREAAGLPALGAANGAVGEDGERGRTLRESAGASARALKRAMACITAQSTARPSTRRMSIGAGPAGRAMVARELRKLPPDSVLRRSLEASNVTLHWLANRGTLRVSLPFEEVLVVDLVENFPRMIVRGNALILVPGAQRSRRTSTSRAEPSPPPRIPSGLYVHGNLVIMTEISPEGEFLDPAPLQVPERLHVGGSLMLLNIDVKDWGANIRIGGDLAVREGGHRLTELPEFAELGGALDCRGCRLLEKLPSNLEHVESLYLEDCSSLESLPDSLARVGGELCLAGCSRLSKLPDYLIVEGNLDMRSCTSLTTLPNLLTVHGNTWLQDAWSLTKIPVTANFQGSKLDLRGCSSLRRLPVVALEKQRRKTLHVDVRATNLEPDSYEVLQSIETDVLKFSFDASVLTLLENSRRANTTDFEPRRSATGTSRSASTGSVTGTASGKLMAQSQGHEARLGATAMRPNSKTSKKNSDQAVPKPRRKTQCLREVGDLNSINTIEDALALFGAEDIELAPFVENAYVRDIIEFLKLLASSLENRVPDLRESLLERLRDVLETAATDEVAREEILMRMADAVDTCVDKPVWALGQMQLVAALAHARGDRTALRKLGLGVMRLGVVHQHASNLLNLSDLDVDDVCVYLKFELELRDDLGLPVSPRAMEWEQYVDVTPEDIEAARAEALAITDADLDVWLLSWAPWQEQLRGEAVVAYEDLKVPDHKLRIEADAATATDLLGDAISDPVVVLPDVANICKLMENYHLPGASSLIEELDRRVMVVLRDGRHLVGILSSIDKYCELALCADRLEK